MAAAGLAGLVRPQAATTTRAALGLLLLSCLVSGLCAATNQQHSAVQEVTSSNWTELLTGHWMVQFYAPWCPSCQQVQKDWENFAKQSSFLDVKIATVDVTEQPGLSGRFFVTKLPTIFHAKDGLFRRYHGSRMVQDLHSFITEKKWNMIEPVAGWKSPSSVLMTGMAGLFHLSGWIRQTHNYFTGPLGMPAWASYISFIMITLLIGLVLGLILVLLIDCVCPAKPKYEVVSADVIQEDVGELEKAPSDDKIASDHESKVSDNDDGEEKKDEQADDNEGSDISNAEKDSGGNSTAEDSGAEEDVDAHIPNPSTPESESALRHRRVDLVPQNGY